MPHHLYHDLRLALRTVSKNTLTTAVIVVTLGLAIGATTIVYSVIDFLWHVALPVTGRDRLVFVASTDPRPGEARSGMLGSLALTGTSVPDLVDWTAQTSTIEQFAAFAFDSASVTGLGTPLRASVLRATTTVSTAWGFRSIAGRTFTPADARAGAPPVAILSEGFWNRQFGRRADVVGSSLTVGGQPHTIIGVWPAAQTAGIFASIDIITPQSLDAAATARDDRQLFVTATLRKGVTREQAGVDLATIAARLQKRYPRTNAQTGIVVRPLIELLGGEVPFILFLLALVAVLVVAIACANVSNILLAQAPSRQREIAVRAALGATRMDQVRRFMTEGVLLSLAAGAVGVALAQGGIALLRRLNTGEETSFSQLALNPRVLLACAATALIAPLVFAFLPAVRSSRTDPTELKDGVRSTGSRSRRRLVSGLVGTQVAFATILSLIIGILGSYTWAWRTAPYGFDPRQVLTFKVDPDARRLAESTQIVRFYDALLARLAAVPGVTNVAAVDQLPLLERGRNVRVVVEGAAATTPEQLPSASLAVVSRQFVETLRVPLVRGRALASVDFDGVGPAVAMISEESARQLWPGQDPIGRRFSIAGAALPTTPLTVVGVVADARSRHLDPRIGPQIYAPLPWAPVRTVAIAVRTSLRDPLALVPAMRREVAAADATLPIFRVATMPQRLLDDSAGMYTVSGLLTAIALVALCMAAAGIYAVVSYSVSQRTREIGVRMAIGAKPAAMARMVIRNGAVPVGLGGLLGLAVAVYVAQAMSTALTEIDTRDPLRYVAVMAVIAVVALMASYIPARRAARVDPVIALRAE